MFYRKFSESPLGVIQNIAESMLVELGVESSEIEEAEKRLAKRREDLEITRRSLNEYQAFLRANGVDKP